MSDWINDRDGSTPRPSTRSWRVVVPVKGGPTAKSRLQAPYGVDRAALALAIALDSLEAARDAVGAASLVVVTSDPDVSRWADGVGVRCVPDPGRGLNEAILAGAALSHAQDGPDGGHRLVGIAAMLGDVPALRASDLRHALAAASAHPTAFVPDAEGTGTVLLCATGGVGLHPHFGTASALAHAAQGGVRLDLDLPGLRRDVDDEAALREALGLGVGAHTAGVLAGLFA